MDGYTKTLLDGIKIAINDASINNWNAKRDNPGYIYNRPFYEEDNVVSKSVVSADVVPIYYPYSLNETDSNILCSYLNNTDSWPNEITVILNNQSYVLSLLTDQSGEAYYGATPIVIPNADIYFDFSNAPINISPYLGDSNYVSISLQFPVHTISVLIDNERILDNSNLWFYYSGYYQGQYSCNIADALDSTNYDIMDGFFSANASNLPETFTLTLDTTDYVLSKHIIDGNIYYGCIYDSYSHGIIFDNNSLGLILYGYYDNDQWCYDDYFELYSDPVLTNYSTLSFTYNDQIILNQAFLYFDRDLIFKSNYDTSLIINSDILSIMPEILIVNIDGQNYQLPLQESEADVYAAYGGYNLVQKYGEYSQYPIYFYFGSNSDHIECGGKAFITSQINHVDVSYNVNETTIKQIDKKFVPIQDAEIPVVSYHTDSSWDATTLKWNTEYWTTIDNDKTFVINMNSLKERKVNELTLILSVTQNANISFVDSSNNDIPIYWDDETLLNAISVDQAVGYEINLKLAYSDLDEHANIILGICRASFFGK